MFLSVSLTTLYHDPFNFRVLVCRTEMIILDRVVLIKYFHCLAYTPTPKYNKYSVHNSHNAVVVVGDDENDDDGDGCFFGNQVHSSSLVAGTVLASVPFSSVWLLRRVRLFVTPWTAAC